MNIKVLHIFYNSYPNISGASTRNRDIVESQISTRELLPIAITAPFQKPLSRRVERINGVTHIRTTSLKGNLGISENKSSLFIKARKVLSLLCFLWKTISIARKVKPDIIHSHSIFFCGLTGFFTARILRLPCLYEVRSLWEERGYAKNRSMIGRLQYKLILFLENFSIKSSDLLVVINKNLKHEILSRSIIDKKKVHVVNNAVNLDKIHKGIPQNAFLSKGFENLTFGYIGTVAPIEGLLYLLQAFKELSYNGITNELLIYGNGKETSKLEQFLDNNSLPNVKLMGAIAPNNIWQAYEKIDVIINPRVSEKITNQVTPLKTLEAMAYRKLVLVSNVGGLLELVEHMKTGIVFKSDSVSSIVQAIKEIKKLDNKVLQQIITTARLYIQEKRSWNRNAETYLELYKSLVND